MAVEESLIGIAQQPVQRAGFDDFVLESGALLVNLLDRLPEQRRRIHVRRFFWIASLRVIEVRRSRGNAEQILLRLEGQQTEALGIRGPDELSRLGIATDSDAIGCLNQD